MSRIRTGNNRASWHDYSSRCIYHITLLKHPEAPFFGNLAGSCKLPVGSPGSSYIRASTLGNAIKQCLRDISYIHPSLRLYQYALMPDHLHIILFAEERLDEIIGRKIGAFKVMVNKKSGINQVFERGFNDQILKKSRNLNVIYNYLKSNPHRLAVRKANPEFFHSKSGIIIGGVSCQLYGNHHLMDNPFKDQVIVHRADSHETFSSNREK